MELDIHFKNRKTSNHDLDLDEVNKVIGCIKEKNPNITDDDARAMLVEVIALAVKF